MTITFVANKYPFSNKEIVSYFENHQDAFNLGEKPDNLQNITHESFFDVTENNKRVGFVFFIPGNLGDIEISLGKTDNNCKLFADKVLSRLDEIKQKLPAEWFDNNYPNNFTKWSAIVKSSNKNFEKLKYFNEKNGFFHSNTFGDEYYFEKII